MTKICVINFDDHDATFYLAEFAKEHQGEAVYIRWIEKHSIVVLSTEPIIEEDIIKQFELE